MKNAPKPQQTDKPTGIRLEILMCGIGVIAVLLIIGIYGPMSHWFVEYDNGGAAVEHVAPESVEQTVSEPDNSLYQSGKQPVVEMVPTSQDAGTNDSELSPELAAFMKEYGIAGFASVKMSVSTAPATNGVVSRSN